MNFTLASTFPYSVRKEDRGNEVGVLQLNLPGVAADGIFGDATHAAVCEWQEEHGLDTDGIAGPATQQSLVVHLQRPASHKHDVPAGMLKSVAFGESTFILWSAGRHLGDSGWDVGVFARSSGSTYPGFDFIKSCFDVSESADWTARNLIEVRDGLPSPVNSQYLSDLAKGDKARLLWQLTVLSHNWPVGARNIASKGSATSNDDAPAQWIIDASRGRLRTPREWCTSYIEKGTSYVKWPKR